MTELMRVVQQGDAFAYGLIHELNQSKEIRLETRPGVWPETVYSGFEGCVSILKDHMVQEDFWKFREPTTTTPREYILIRAHLGWIRRKYFWHGMTKDIKDYVKTCDIC
jgi:hypothetical protein